MKHDDEPDLSGDNDDPTEPAPKSGRRKGLIAGAAVVLVGTAGVAAIVLNEEEKGPPLDVSAEVLCGPLPDSSTFLDGVSGARFRWAEGETIFGVLTVTNNEKVPVTLARVEPVEVEDDLDLTIRAGSSTGPDDCDGTETGPGVEQLEIAAGGTSYVNFTIEMNSCRVKQEEGASVWRRSPALMARIDREGVGSDVPTGPYGEIEYWFPQGCDGS